MKCSIPELQMKEYRFSSVIINFFSAPSNRRLPQEYDLADKLTPPKKEKLVRPPNLRVLPTSGGNSLQNLVVAGFSALSGVIDRHIIGRDGVNAVFSPFIGENFRQSGNT
jgi:hypothetical protein